MMRLWGFIFWLSLGCGLLLAANTIAAPITGTDSIRQLHRWPLATQLQVARVRLVQLGPRVAAVAELVQQRDKRLPRAVQLELLGTLAGFYIHESQPSLAIARLLEMRQRAGTDSVHAGHAAMWLSYCYQQLRQSRLGLMYGREAVRVLPHRAADYAIKLGQAYRILADCARMVPDYPLDAYYMRQALAIARRAHDTPRMAVALTYLGETARLSQHPAQAAALLDSARALYDARPYPDLLVLEQELAARLALAQGRYQAAERELAVLRPLISQEPLWETDVLTLQVPALTGQRRYREALANQQRLQVLLAIRFEENANRRAQELEIRYATAQREQELARQRQRITLLRTQAQLRTAQYSRRLAQLGTATLAGVLLLTLGLLAWTSRQRRLRVVREERLRNRIAADLHDEVGTLLTRVNMQADLLSQQQPHPALERLLGNSRAAAGTMRDIVWGIDAQSDTVGSLLDRMRDHLDQTAAPAGLNTHLATNGLPDALVLPPELRQHLYLVFKEAVTNAARHARQASDLWVSLTRANGQLQLMVHNNGQTAGSSRSGMGLRSMRQRAEALRGTLVAGPEPEGGFRVRLVVPF
jgi:signal transduction histidine kinase